LGDYQFSLSYSNTLEFLYEIGSRFQIHFVNSLLNGRLVFDERKNRFQTLSPFLVFIEGTWTEGSNFEAISKANEEFFGQIVTIVMKKSAQSDFAILNQVA